MTDRATSSKRRLLDERIGKIRKMRDEGKTYREIRTILNISNATILRAVSSKARECNRINSVNHYKTHKDDRVYIEKKQLYDKVYYRAHKEEIAVYLATHKEEIAARRAVYNAAHKKEITAYGKAYRKAHKEKMAVRDKASNATYRKTHKKEIKAWNEAHKKEAAAYRAAHREAYRELARRYRQEHKSEFNARAANHRALKQGARIGATANQLAEIKEIYRKAKEAPRVRCYLCGKLIPKGRRHVDHIVPLSRGGAHRPSNLAAACAVCNGSKHNKPPEEVGILI